jgi:pimeloyl-ACP methyl ester carboxylesterase
VLNLQLSYKASSINYLQFGSGPNTVVCFHGYGEEAASFSFLETYGGDEFTFYAIDLPFHGKTVWKDGADFSSDDLQFIVEEIVTGSKVHDAKQSFQLMGYSLGGRVCLSLYEKIPAQVQRIVLLAPDGLKMNFWYWLATQNVVGNRLFAFTMKHPKWFFIFLKGFYKLKLANASIFKFVNYYIANPEVRRLLYERWTGLRKLRPHLQKIKTIVRKYKTPIRLVYGKHDRIILPVRGEKFIKGIEDNCRLTVISSGHQVLHEKHAKEILAALLH